jgi:hypothetical protein
MNRNLKLKVFIGSDMELKFVEAYDQTGKNAEILPEDMERLKYFLGTLVNRKASPEFKIPPRLLSILGIQSCGDSFYIIPLKDFNTVCRN